MNGRRITVSDPANGNQPFANNIIPANRINKNGQTMLNLFPLPNFLDEGRRISG